MDKITYVKTRFRKDQSSVKDTQAAVIIHLPSATVEVLEGTSSQTVEAVLLALKNIC